MGGIKTNLKDLGKSFETFKKQQWESQLVPYFNAEVLYQDSRYSIEKYINENTGKYSLCVIREKTFTDWVMVYGPNHVGYDNPFNIAESIKVKVRQFSINLNQ